MDGRNPFRTTLKPWKTIKGGALTGPTRCCLNPKGKWRILAGAQWGMTFRVSLKATMGGGLRGSFQLTPGRFVVKHPATLLGESFVEGNPLFWVM